MADIINLRRARKARARVEAENLAAENRARFGRTGAEKKRETAQKTLDEKRLEGHRRDDDKP
ncbi:DUF4169 family protein [Zavarzinia sp.]|uniref:DUF4169 family protein n=1 Tax=Zavarzinia sp. TaxID=2027920 RepID=UPI003BB5AD30|nr:DUF4169 family protein [Zavarzinia sp.]